MKNVIKDRYDRKDRKLFVSMGPMETYETLATLTYYTPYWRKICRMLCNLRCMDHSTFDNNCHERMAKYAQQSFDNMKLPEQVKNILWGCLTWEFKIYLDR